jgi:hypothetical protein
MASKKTLNLDNLAALGPERLAAILVDLAAGNAEIRRRLRLELAAQAGGGDALAAEVGKRLTALRTARSFVDWQKRREFLKDLDQQRVMIVDRIAQTRPDLALDLMWQFMDLAEPVFNRVDDSNGSVGDVFHTACDNLATIALMARPDPASLADRVFTALSKNDYGLFDNLVKVIFPALGETGVARLRTRLTEALTSRPRGADKRDRHADAFRRALQAMADSEGDVDAYIALIPVEDLDRPYIGAAVGRRLLAAGRANEALAALERSKPKRQADRSRQYDELYELGYLRGHDDVWDEVYIDALDATGHGERAQQLRRAAFEERLSSENLRAYLKKLPDFEDVEAEDWAMRHALGFRNFSAALYFFHQWPDPAHAAQLVLDRASEIDGNAYYLLDPVARQIEGKHPLAATLLRRAMIDDTLEGAKSSRYKHAARHLLECQSLAMMIRDYGTFETDEAFTSRLRASHARKTGFWKQVAEVSGTQP